MQSFPERPSARASPIDPHGAFVVGPAVVGGTVVGAAAPVVGGTVGADGATVVPDPATVVVGAGTVLAGADVSIAVGGGTDLAKVSAEVVLLGESLAPLVLGVEAARRCMRVIRQNIAWAILYNVTAVPLAASGWLQPWMAAIGMSTSSLLVVLNAMRLLGVRQGKTKNTAPQANHAPGIDPA